MVYVLRFHTKSQIRVLSLLTPITTKIFRENTEKNTQTQKKTDSHYVKCYAIQRCLYIGMICFKIIHFCSKLLEKSGNKKHKDKPKKKCDL